MSIIGVLIVIGVVGSLFVKSLHPLTVDWRVLGVVGIGAGMVTVAVRLHEGQPTGAALAATLVATVLYMLGRARRSPRLHVLALVVGVFGPIATTVWEWDPGTARVPIGLVLLGTLVIVALVGFKLTSTTPEPEPELEPNA